MLKITPRTTTSSGRTDLGSVATYVISPRRAVCVFDESKDNPLNKLACGHVESSDENIFAAAKREVLEETGVEVLDSQITLVYEQQRENGSYYPNFCVARVSDAQISARKKIGNEDGRPIKTKVFNRAEILGRLNMEFVPKHQAFIRLIEGVE